MSKDTVLIDSCGVKGEGGEEEEDDEEEMEDMFVKGPAGVEWNGPTRGKLSPIIPPLPPHTHTHDLDHLLSFYMWIILNSA